jgi:circadian clock protein KaiB
MSTKTAKGRAAGGTGNGGLERGVPAASTPVRRITSSLAGAMVRRTVKLAKVLARRRTAKLWQLRLYVMDHTPKSATAFSNLKKFCETHLKGRYRIRVIDLLKQPHLAKGDQILAIPTVVRKLPKPVRTIIGSLTDVDRVLVGLDLRAAD